MITYRTEAAASAPACPSALVETNPVKIIARAMIELQASGHVVDAEAIGEKTLLTSDEIEANWRAGRDEARRRLRRAA